MIQVISPYVFPSIKKPPISFGPNPNKIVYITERVCEFLDLPISKVMSQGRKGELVFARQLCMYLIRKHSDESFKAIGDAFQRDHSTVISAVDTIENYIFSDYKQTKELIQMIENRYTMMCGTVGKKSKLPTLNNF